MEPTSNNKTAIFSSFDEMFKYIFSYIQGPILKIITNLISLALNYVKYFFATALALIYFFQFSYIIEILQLEEFIFYIFKLISTFYPINITPGVNISFSEILKVIFIFSTIFIIASIVIKFILKKIFNINIITSFKHQLLISILFNTIIHIILILSIQILFTKMDYIILLLLGISYMVTIFLILLSMSFGYLSKSIFKLNDIADKINSKPNLL